MLSVGLKNWLKINTLILEKPTIGKASILSSPMLCTSKWYKKAHFWKKFAQDTQHQSTPPTILRA